MTDTSAGGGVLDFAVRSHEVSEQTRAAPARRSALRRAVKIGMRSCVLLNPSLHVALLLLASLVGERPELLVTGGQRRDVLIVELLCEKRHRIRTGVAEAALPHLQLEGDIARAAPACSS